MESKSEKKLVAKVYLADKDRNYVPGDAIEDGRLFEEADYYESLGQVEWIDADAGPIQDEPKPAKETLKSGLRNSRKS